MTTTTTTSTPTTSTPTTSTITTPTATTPELRSADTPVVELLGAHDAPLLARGFYGGGDPGPIVASLAHVPELLEVALPFIGATLGPSSIAFRTKEIVILRTSVLLGCRYCVASHTPVALDSGLTHREVHALRNEASVDETFDSLRDRLLIAWTDAVAGNQTIPDKLTNDMRASFAAHEIVELTLLVGCTLLLNRYATALRLPVGEATVARLEAEGMVLA